MASDAVVVPAAGTGGPVDAARASGARRTAATMAVLAGYVLAAVAVTWHLWANPARLAVAGNPWDADLFAWYMRYSASAVAHGHLPALISTTLNAPQGISMMWNTAVLLPGILLTPVTLLAGPQASLTVLTTAGFAGSAASLMLVLRRWRFGVWPAALAGAVYGFSPALVQSAIGHYNLQFAVLPPLLVDAGLRLFVVPAPAAVPAAAGSGGSAPAPPRRVARAGRGSSVRAGAVLGLLAAAQLFLAEELLALSAATGALLAVTLVLARPVELARRARAALRSPARDRAAALGLAAPVAGAAAAAVVLLALAGVALLTQFAGPLTQHGSPFYPDYYKNDLTVFTTPSGYVIWHSVASAIAASWLPGGAPEQLGYLGWPMIAVLAGCAAALWRDRLVRALAIGVAVLELLSLGGHPEVHGVTHQNVTLPWHWIEGLPVIGLALPDRLSIFADGLAAVLLAVLAERAVARARDKRGQPGRARGPGGTARLADGTRRADGSRLAHGAARPVGGPRRQVAWLAAGVVAAAVAPIVPVPLPAAAVPAVPAGWSATFAALRLPPGARVLLVPVPNAGLTNAMRWQATTGTDISLIGGYFMGPAYGGQAYVDGQGARPTANYLDWLWLQTPAGRKAATGTVSPVAPPPVATVTADLAYWRPAAVVADVSLGSALGRFLSATLGPPTITAGSIMAWRLPPRSG